MKCCIDWINLGNYTVYLARAKWVLCYSNGKLIPQRWDRKGDLFEYNNEGLCFNATTRV